MIKLLNLLPKRLVEMIVRRNLALRETTFTGITRFVIDNDAKIIDCAHKSHGMVVFDYPELLDAAHAKGYTDEQILTMSDGGDPDLYAIMFNAGFIRGGMLPGNLVFAGMSASARKRSKMQVLDIAMDKQRQGINVEFCDSKGEQLKYYICDLDEYKQKIVNM